MDSGNQKIIFYFIEEAQEHLETLEKGILDLRAVMEDQERVNEMFRAAHSVKGGAAMLGFDSIKTTAHKLEDCFKILRENPIPVDQKLETMFLRVYDTLQILVEQLQGPFGLREDEAEKAVKEAEPNFAQLEAYLNKLLTGSAAQAPAPVTPPPKQVAQQTQVAAPNITAQVTEILKKMLQVFKQQETPATRQQLESLCKQLLKLGSGVETWQTLIKITYKAIVNPKNSYRNLAPVLIKEIKQASDLLATGKSSAIAPSPSLKQLATAPKTAPAPAPQQITIPVEPKSAAKVIIQAFNKKQLSELVVLLHKATR
ncbi:MAG: Hpt domain-containing protein [Crinalium sp.]